MPKRGKVVSRNVSTVSTMSEFPEPVAVQRNIPEIFEIFHNVQYNTVQHKKYIKELKKVFRKIDYEAFSESFANALHYLFLFGEANGNVDRVMQFVANFCGSLNNEREEFLHYIFGVIFNCMNVAGHGVRSRACQLLGLILTALGDDASLNDDICDKILSKLLERLQDIRGAVRSRAVLALQRLQNPTDPECPVTRAYTFHMSCDPSAAVRRGVVLSLGKSSSNLLHVFERLCDVDESVRKAAFLYVSSINVTKLKVRQRVHILKVGLTERSLRVRRVVETALLPGWLGAYQGNVLELLASVRLDNLQGAKDSAVVAGNLLQALFKHQQLAELLEWLPVDPKVKLIPADQLSKESAWYWRHMVRHLHSIQDTDHLDKVLPELIIFTGYVRALVESPCPDALEQPVEFSRRQYVMQELVSMFPVYDMADEVGRHALQALLYDTLTGNHGPLEEDVIRAIMRAIELVVSDVHKRIEFVAGIISEIHEPSHEVENVPLPPTPQESTETKIMRAELRVALNEAQEEQEDAVRVQNFVLAAECKQKVDTLAKKLTDFNTNLKEVVKQKAPVVEVIREKRNDPPTLNKCLTILNMLLDTPDISSLTPVLRSLFQSLEVELYQMAEIRESALQTVALYSMLDEDFAKEQKAFFFAQFMDTDNENLLITALKCVIDVVLTHGVKMFNIDVPQEKKTTEEGENVQEKSVAKKNKSIKVSKRKKNKLDDAARKSRASDLWESDSPSSEEESEIEDVQEPEGGEEMLGTPSTHDTIIQLFLGFMNSECSESRFVVVEGLCRMLMAGRLSSSSLISRLLLLWFNPATEDEDALKQLLGTFFPLFASNTESGPEQLEAAFLPTVLTLANAPMASPLAEVDHEAVLKFIIGLTMPSVAPTALDVHSNLAVLIVNTLERDEETAAPLLCRALSLLTPPREAALCRDLLRSAGELMTVFTDKISFRNVSRFHAHLSTALDNLELCALRNTMETLSEVTEPRSSLNTSTSGSTDKGSEAPESGSEPEKVDTVSVASPSSAQSRNSISVASPLSAQSRNTISVASPSSVESRDTEMESVSTPSKAGSDKIRRITAAYVARRALLKTPSRRRRDVTAESPSAPTPSALATPSRALEPPPAPLATPLSTRRSARNASTAKKVLEAQEGPRGRGSTKSVSSEDDKKAGNSSKGKAVQGLGKLLEKVSVEEGIAARPKGKRNQKAFELFETKKGPANKGKGRKKVPDTPVKEVESSSEEEQIEESSDEDTVLHTICHDEGEAISIINNSSSEDEESPYKSGDITTVNKTVPETPETSDQSEEEEDEDSSEKEESSAEEEVIPTLQKRLKRNQT